MDRQPLVRLALRKMERQLRRDGKSSEADLVERAQRDGKLFEVVSNECECCYSEQRSGGNFGGKLTDFIDFILSRADEIVAFIKMILDLFPA